MPFVNRKQENLTFKIIFPLIANFACFGICYYSGLPMRLEHIGTYFAAAAFGVGPAITIAVISQLLYSLFYFGFSNVLMLMPVLLAIFLIAAAKSYGWLDTMISSLGTMSVVAIGNALLITIISLWIGRVFLVNTCWLEIYDMLGRHLRYHRFEATLITVSSYAILNTFLTWIIAILAYRISPKQTTFGFSDNTNYKKRLQNRK